jgi:glycerophosphoryl diester phosphodiesterase
MTSVVAPLLPRVIGHRGAMAHAPENTLAGLRKAAALGTRWVEFDVRLSADGRVILLHDDTVDRTTDGTGIAAEMTLDGLAAYDAGGWFAPEFQGQTIPTLEEAIDLLEELGLGANIELKAHPGQEVETARATAGIVAATWPRALPPPLFSSFAAEALMAARDTAPDIARGLLVGAIEPDWRDRARAVEAATVHCDHQDLGRDLAAEIRAAGYPLYCYTVNRPERAQDLFDWGVSGVFTDVPDRILPVTAR